MAIRHVVALSRGCKLTRAFSASAGVTRPPLAVPDVIFYNDELVKTEAKFLKYNSPYLYLHDHTPILSAPLTRVTTLPNGLRVATESATTATATATVGVWIVAGSESNGTANFLKHMLTRQLQEEIENTGGCLYSHTCREHTHYYAKVIDKDVPLAIHILSHILQNPKFDDNKIEHERHVIFRQMEKKVEGHTEEVIFDHLHATAFQRSPLGRTILGPAEKVKTITKEDLRNYMSTHYTTPRMVIVATGAVKHEEIVEQVKSSFTKLPQGSTTTSELVANEPAVFTGSEFRNVDKDVPLAQFVVACKGASWTDPDSIALMVMQEMLGSYTRHTRSSGVAQYKTSRLIRMIDGDNMAESMMTFNTSYKDTGLFGVYATAKPDCLEFLARLIMRELNGLFYVVPQINVVLARDQLKSSLLLRMDGTSPVAEDIGRQLLTYGRRIPYAELFARIDAIDNKTIMRVANRFILDKDIAIAAAGPIEGLPEYKWFRRNTYRQRCSVLS